MAEFALIAPVFILLVVGLLVFGRLFFYWIEANHLANETARWAVVDNNPYDNSCPGGPWTGGPGCQSLQQAARSSATDEFENTAKVCIDFPDPVAANPGRTKSFPDVKVGDPVRVKVQLPVTFFRFFGFGVTLRGAATLRMENISDGVDPTAFTDAGNIGPCT